MQVTSDRKKTLRVLLIEDDEDDAILLVDYLHSSGLEIDCLRVDTEPDLVSALKKPWDIVFSDYSMPGFSGTRALEIMHQYDPDLPFIFVSGTIGEQAAVEAIKSGANDYVMKEQLSRLLPTIDRELREVESRRERRQAEEMLRKLSLVVKQAAESVFITDTKGCIEYVNPAFEDLTLYTANEAMGNTPSILRSGKHTGEYYEQMWQTINRGEVFRGTIVNRRQDGGMFYEEKIITPLKDVQGRITHFVSTGRDITARVMAEEARTRLANILEATPDMVAIMDLNGNLLYLNSAGRRLLGVVSEENIEGLCIKDLFHEPMAEQLRNDIIPSVRRDGIWSGEAVIRIEGGAEMPVSQIVLAHKNEHGEIEYLSTIARDISERKRFEEKLHHQATHDSLTDLPNRYYLVNRFASMIECARRSGTHVAVLFLDLDNFKRVNDSLGHAAGDSMLQQVARRLRSCLRPNDTIARLGGDEFTVVVGDLERAENALTVLQRLRDTFVRPIIIGNHEVYVTFSAGISLYPHDGDRVDDLLRHADSAMYEAKSSVSNQYRFYSPDMNARGHELLQLEADLRRALEKHEFRLHYQPQIDLRSGRMIGAEGLIRWQHPERGLVSPADFVPLLENSGMIVPVGEWVLHEACRVHRSWREKGYKDIRISVNVSAAQFNDEGLLDKVRQVIRQEEMPNRSLELEITENIVMRDPVKAAELLQAFHEMGVSTAIDDFGTGYSSLAYLKRFPLNVLKIDRTFVSELTQDTGDAAIVEASISLAKKLGLQIVAEGVENQEQLEFLHRNECDLVQGFYLSRPVPEDEILKLLKKKWKW